MTVPSNGWKSGFVGVVIFSGSLPATRAAMAGFDPIFLTVARATISGAIALAVLALSRTPRFQLADAPALAITSLGVVVGFPLLSALALRHMDAAHSLVFTGLLPLVTAVFGVTRGGERPRTMFWIFACLGGSCVAGFAVLGNEASASIGDIMMIGAVLVCGFGHAEGAVLARKMGGWQVICWALVLSLPFMMVSLLLINLPDPQPIGLRAWAGLGYVSTFSMLIGFVFWYRGLAQGGIAAVSQLQLLQPILGLVIASIFLHEPITSRMVMVSIAVFGCVAAAKRYS